VAVFAGMLAVTVSGLVFTPVFYVLPATAPARQATAVLAAQ